MLAGSNPPRLPLPIVFYREAGLTIDDEALKEAGITVLSSGWYFWMEGWEDDVGPYPTEEECEEGLRKHAWNL